MFIKKDTLTQVFSCKFCEIFKNILFTEHLSKTTSQGIQRRALRLMLNEYETSYEDLLKRSGKPSKNLRRIKTLLTEIYKTINNLNPEFMKNLFKFCKNNRAHRRKVKLFFEIRKSNQVSCYKYVCTWSCGSEILTLNL